MQIKGFRVLVKSLRVEAIALFPFILYRTANPGRVLLNHERIHLRQQLELAILPFYVWYLLEFLIRYLRYRNWYLAYLHISFEREAYRNQYDLDYLSQRKMWAFLKHL